MYYSFAKNYTTCANRLITKITLFEALPPKNPVIVNAIWDTGANQSVIAIELKTSLNLIPVSSKLVFGVNSKQYVDIVTASIKLPNDLYLQRKRFYVCSLPPGVDMLIGMDIIQLGDFHISNAGGKTHFSFVIPSLPQTYSLVEEADRLNGITAR
jgi:hypothetical protein